MQVMEWEDPAKVQMSVTAIEMVRGILATIHIETVEKFAEKDLWKVFRSAFKDETIHPNRQGSPGNLPLS